MKKAHYRYRDNWRDDTDPGFYEASDPNVKRILTAVCKFAERSLEEGWSPEYFTDLAQIDYREAKKIPRTPLHISEVALYFLFVDKYVVGNLMLLNGCTNTRASAYGIADPRPHLSTAANHGTATYPFTTSVKRPIPKAMSANIPKAIKAVAMDGHEINVVYRGPVFARE